MRARLIVAAIVLAAGCGEGKAPAGKQSRDTSAADSAPAHAAADSTGRGVAAAQTGGVPKVLEGVCPFECCTYGEWTALDGAVAYRAERDTGAAAFTLAAGEKFTAHDGNVHVDQAGLAIVTDTAELRRGMGQTYGLAPGDSVPILAPAGEGHMWMWNGRKTFTADPMYGARIVREVKWDWWVRVTSAAGRVGWLRMRDHRGRIGGADACA